MHSFLSTNEFTKYQGNGNDFVIFEADAKSKDLSHIAQKICDRHRGIGADGLILLSKEKDWHMVLYNADGSLAQNCGNGLRCVALYIFDKTGEQQVSISFAGKNYLCKKVGELISVEMGVAQVQKLPAIDLKCGQAQVAKASIGNDHVVVFFDKPINPKEAFLEIKQVLSIEDVNVGILFAEGQDYFSVVFERGVGFTESCATGACVAASFLAVLNPSLVTKNIMIRQPGGEIEVNNVKLEQVGEVHMFKITQTAAASAVFTGYWPKNHELIAH